MAVPLRLFDVSNCKIGAVQVKGASGSDVNYGYREQSANNDGQIAESAHDKLAFFADGTLRCNDVAGFPIVIALFEDNDTQDVLAEGKVAGDIANANKVTLERAKLVSVLMDYRSGQYLQTTYSLANSADNATPSTAAKDEVIIASLARAVTTSGDARLVKFDSASFDPNGAAPAIAPLGIRGLGLSVAGDEDFGENVEVSGYQVTGRIEFQDLTLSTGSAVAQELLDADYGVLTLNYSPEGARPSGRSCSTI
jgi:hypothetical protein